MVLLMDKAAKREMEELRTQAKLHGAEFHTPGLDFSDAVPVETLLDRGIKEF